MGCLRWLVALLAVGCSCNGGEHTLVVFLITDYSPAELASIEISIPVSNQLEVSMPSGDLLEGVRIAELPVSEGAHLVRGRAFGPDDQVLQRREVVAHVSGRTAITLVMTRSCEDVDCTSEAARTECIGGRCVSPECTPENPSACPAEADCSDDDQCASEIACGAGVCLNAFCFEELDDALCMTGEMCSPDGCVMAALDASPTDAGEQDAGGQDAGEQDAGEQDAGMQDAGRDAGMQDATPDADLDAEAVDSAIDGAVPQPCENLDDCNVFDSACEASIGNVRCLSFAATGAQVQLLLIDPYTGDWCGSPMIDRPGGFLTSRIFRVGESAVIWLDECNDWLISLQDGSDQVLAAGAPAPCRAVRVGEQIGHVVASDDMNGALHVAGSSPVPYSLSFPSNAVYILGPNELGFRELAPSPPPVHAFSIPDFTPTHTLTPPDHGDASHPAPGVWFFTAQGSANTIVSSDDSGAEQTRVTLSPTPIASMSGIDCVVLPTDDGSF